MVKLMMLNFRDAMCDANATVDIGLHFTLNGCHTL